MIIDWKKQHEAYLKLTCIEKKPLSSMFPDGCYKQSQNREYVMRTHTQGAASTLTLCNGVRLQGKNTSL